MQQEILLSTRKRNHLNRDKSSDQDGLYRQVPCHSRELWRWHLQFTGGGVTTRDIPRSEWQHAN